MDMKFLARL